MKCDQYWPARGTETHGMIQVCLVDVVELATYTVRTFQLTRVRCQPYLTNLQPRSVKEFVVLFYSCIVVVIMPRPLSALTFDL